MTDYEKAHAKYRDLATKALHGDAQAKADKAKAMNEIRNIERQSARNGVVLQMVMQPGGAFQETRKEERTKRDMQEEYCRKFDNTTPVEIDGKKTTTRAWNTKRLLGR